jgi:pimeloyl-ACP methyl ester carboxylesterase
MGALLVKILFTVAGAYCFAVLWMWTRQEHYLFQPKHYEPLPEFEKFRWDRVIDGIGHQGWLLNQGKEKTVLYYGGNAEDLAGHCETFSENFDANVLMMNYRGYGQSEGKPGETELIADGIAMYDLFREETGTPVENIFLMGRSLGTGVAVQVAAARPAAGVILATPYEGIYEIARFQYPWLPIRYMLRHTFRSADHAPNIRTPVLVLLAEHDEVIPIESGRRLGDLWGGPKEIVTLPMGHMDIHEHPGYFEAINRFVNTSKVERSNVKGL